MALQNVDVVDAQSFQAVLHRREDVLEQGQPRVCESPSQERIYLAGEPMAVDVTNFVRSCQDGRPVIIPNHEEHLCGPLELIVKTCCLEGTRPWS